VNPVIGETLREVRGVFLALFAFSCFMNVLIFAGPLYMMQVYDRVLSSRSEATLFALLFIILIVYAVVYLLDLIRSRISVRIGLLIDERLRGPVFDAIMHQRVQNSGVGDGFLPIRDLETVRGFFSTGGTVFLLDLPWAPLFLFLLYLFHPLLALVTVIGMIVISLVTWQTARLTSEAIRETTLEGSRRNAFMNDTRAGAEAIEALGMTGEIRKIWGGYQDRLAAQSQRTSDISMHRSALVKAIRMGLQAILLAVGALLVIEQAASAGIILGASMIASRALQPIEQLNAQWRSLVMAKQAYERLRQSLRPPLEAPTSLPAPTGKLIVKDLHLAPPGTRELTLAGVSFTAEAGTVIAVVGPNAAGKSTLSRALVGLWTPLRGDLRLDGATLDRWSPEDRGRFTGYLPQSVELVSGPVWMNISRFQSERDDKATIEAARRAGAHEMIQRLPEGYDTEVGMGGMTLSAGQRQRIGLARALYGNPFLVVLDEPNANLDAEGEAALKQAIRGLREQGAIVIVVAHRQAILEDVDFILVLRNGRQLAFGPREEIAKSVMGMSVPGGPKTNVRVLPNAKA
jgi:ATP-binding cassette subfamily C protein PrsD